MVSSCPVFLVTYLMYLQRPVSVFCDRFGCELTHSHCFLVAAPAGLANTILQPVRRAISVWHEPYDRSKSTCPLTCSAPIFFKGRLLTTDWVKRVMITLMNVNQIIKLS